jgi:hypothetical protein
LCRRDRARQSLDGTTTWTAAADGVPVTGETYLAGFSLESETALIFSEHASHEGFGRGVESWGYDSDLL